MVSPHGKTEQLSSEDCIINLKQSHWSGVRFPRGGLCTLCFSDNDRANQTHLMKSTKDFLIHHITSKEHNQLRVDAMSQTWTCIKGQNIVLSMFCNVEDALFETNIWRIMFNAHLGKLSPIKIIKLLTTLI